MEITPKQHITGSLITNATTTLFTATKVTIITQWWLANSHSGDVVIEGLWVVPALGSADESNNRLPNVTVGNTLPLPFDTREVLQVNDTIQAKASVTNVVALSAAGWEEV